MAAKSFDPEVLKTTVMDIMQQMLSKMTGLVQSSDPEIKELEIIDYEGRMKVSGVEKFDAVSFISVINFYLNEADKARHKGAKGALVLYVDFENAGKLFKGLGIKFHEDEDDNSMLNACGEFNKLIAEEFKTRLGLGVISSEPHNFRNSILEGVEFSPDQKTKYEFSFFYLKRKAIAVEVTLADIPRK